MSSALPIIVSLCPPGYPSARLHPANPGTVIVAPEITGGLVVTSDFGGLGGRRWFCAFSQSCSFDQTATHSSCCKFAR
jgi:hypothetical protein